MAIAFDERKFSESIIDLVKVAVEQCAQAVIDIPVSASLYQDAKTAQCVAEFKMRAVEAIRDLAKPQSTS